MKNQTVSHTIAADLEQLGLVRGDAVLVRAATRSIVPNRPHAADILVEAVRQVIGSEGTLLALSFSPLFSTFRKPKNYVFGATAPITTGGFTASVLRQQNSV